MTVSENFWAFLTLFSLLYFCIPKRLQPALLLAGSLAFFGFSGWAGLCIPVWLSLVAWVWGRILTRVSEKGRAKAAQCPDKIARRLLRASLEKRKKRLLVPGVFLLFAPFILWRWMGNSLFGLRPLGIAYMTLSVVGYVADVGRGDAQSAKNPLSLLLFLAYFPALCLGPVSRYTELYPQLTAPHTFSATRAGQGGIRILWGLFKKLVVADTAALLCASLLPGQIPLLVLLYTLRIYGDFTGGMDIFMGISHMLGISLYENFDRPFSSPSPAIYWRRWHRSLSRWLTDYVFYPLSTGKPVCRATDACRRIFGDRIGLRLPLYASVLVTWCVAGLWHGFGWNNLLWGFCNGVVLLALREAEPLTKRWEKSLPEKIKPFWQGICVLLTVTLVGILRLLDLCGTDAPLLGGTEEASVALWWVTIAGAAIMFLTESRRPLSESGEESLAARLVKRPLLAAVCMAVLLLLVLVFGQYGIGYDAQDFIYGI